MEPQLQRPILAPQHLAPLLDSGPRLNNLPLDVTFNILEECSAYDIISLESTCRSIRASIRSTQGCAIFINRVKQDSYEAMTIYHIDKIQIEQQKWRDRRWEKDKPSSAAPVPWTIAMESEQDEDYVEPGFPAAKALREFRMEDQPLDEQCKDLRKYIKLAEFFSSHCRLALARKRRGLGIKVEEPDANDTTTKTTYMHNTARQNQNDQNDQLSPFLQVLGRLTHAQFMKTFLEYWIATRVFQCYIGAGWPSHIRGDNWVWVPACEKIFGTQQQYSYCQFGRIAAMKEFIGQCLGAYLVWCDSLWRRRSLVRGINIQSGPGGQKGMLENHIQCYVGLCTQDKISHPGLYIEWLIRALDLPGIGRLLISSYNGELEHPILTTPNLRMRRNERVEAVANFLYKGLLFCFIHGDDKDLFPNFGRITLINRG